MILFLESFCDVENYNVCSLIPRTTTIILTSNKYGIADKIKGFCKKENISIMILNNYDIQDIRGMYLYIDLVTTVAEYGILLAKEYTRGIKEYQITGQHKNKKFMYFELS